MPRLIKFSCQGCGTKLAVPQEMAGLSDQCPKCGALVTSPTLEQWQASQAAVQKPESPPKPSAPPTPVPPEGWSASELADALNPPPKEAPAPAEAPPPEPKPAPQEKRPAVIPRTVSSLLAAPNEAPPASSAPQNPTAPLPPAAEAPSLLSRVLSASESSYRPPKVRPPAESPAITPSEPKAAEDGNEAFTSPTEDTPADEEEEARQQRATLYRSPHTPGLGELLASITSKDAAEGESRPPLRSTPFIEPPVPTKVKRRRQQRLLKWGFLAFLMVDLAVLAMIYRKELVEFWHAKMAPAGEVQQETSPESAPVEPASSSEPLAVPEVDFTTQQPAQDTPSMPAAEPETLPVVPQAIPISEEQLAKMQQQDKRETVPAPEPAVESAPPAMARTEALPSEPALPSADPLASPEETPPNAPSPAPVAETGKPYTNKIPAEARKAFEAVTHFLEAADWRARSRHVMQASRLMNAMEKDAMEFGDGPIKVGSIIFAEQYKGSAEPYFMFELEGGDLKHQVMAIVVQPSNGNPLVDWESFTEFRRDLLLKFLETPGSPTRPFRVVLRRKHYFDKDVPDIASKESFQVNQPNVNYEGNVFVSKNSALHPALATKLPWGMDILVIAELAWKKSAQHQWVEIQSIPYYGWRKS